MVSVPTHTVHCMCSTLHTQYIECTTLNAQYICICSIYSVVIKLALSSRQNCYGLRLAVHIPCASSQIAVFSSCVWESVLFFCECVSVCVCVREQKRKGVCVCERECVCVCVKESESVLY